MTRASACVGASTKLSAAVPESVDASTEVGTSQGGGGKGKRMSHTSTVARKPKDRNRGLPGKRD